MKRGFLFFYFFSILFTGCYTPITEETNDTEPSEITDDSGATQLSVSLFTSADADIYPAVLLVFDEQGDRIKDLTLNTAQSKSTLSLNRGTYRLVALSGTVQYGLPNQYSLESLISSPSQGFAAKPLMMGQAEVTLSSAAVHASIQMKMQTAAVSFSIAKFPSHAEKVLVVLSDIYTGVSLRGAYTQPHAVTLPCVYSNGLWQTETCHIFPSQSNNAVVNLAFETPDSTAYYTYNLTYPLSAGHAYQLEPSVDIDVQVDEQIIDAGNESGWALDTLWVDQIQAAPFLVDGHIALWTDTLSENKLLAWLLSQNEWENVASAYSETQSSQATDIADSYSEGGNQCNLKGWMLPSKEVANQLKITYGADACVPLNNIIAQTQGMPLSQTTNKGEKVRYLCNNGQNTFTLASAKSSLTKAGSKATYRLRLVKQVCLVIK